MYTGEQIKVRGATAVTVQYAGQTVSLTSDHHIRKWANTTGLGSALHGVKKYHHYLFGREFEIKMDHKSLMHIFSESRATPMIASGRIQRWALTLGAYNYIIRGKDN